jgi:hypothetical protein
LSSGSYKINAQINGISLNECSYIVLNDSITPYFEESISKDPDITSLIVQLRNDIEDVPGWRVVYSLKKETEQYSQAIQVENLDSDLPSFKIPSDLPMGSYSFVFQIMSGKNILQKTEKEIYFLGDVSFAYDGIDIHLPGISNNSQLVSKNQVVMLEAKLNFDEKLDPYIVWYDGKAKIAEGKYSEGAGCLFWKAPEQINFYPLRAEVFPVRRGDSFTGYKRDVFVVVSPATPNINLISEKIPELTQWYVFEGNLNDSTKPPPAEHRAASGINTGRPRWMPFNGTYGLATGEDSLFALPKITTQKGVLRDSWQMLFRFKPINEGSILKVNFDSSSNVSLDLSLNDEKLVITLLSSTNEVSHIYNLPLDDDSFIVMGVNIFITPGYIAAKVNILGETAEQGELAWASVNMETANVNDFQIILGYASEGEEDGEEKYIASGMTALWDEFALYNNSSIDVIAAEIKKAPANLALIYE